MAKYKIKTLRIGVELTKLIEVPGLKLRDQPKNIILRTQLSCQTPSKTVHGSTLIFQLTNNTNITLTISFYIFHGTKIRSIQVSSSNQ